MRSRPGALSRVVATKFNTTMVGISTTRSRDQSLIVVKIFSQAFRLLSAEVINSISFQFFFPREAN